MVLCETEVISGRFIHKKQPYFTKYAQEFAKV